MVCGPEDYALYFYLSVGVIVANGSVNLIYSRSFVRFLIQPMRALLEYAKQMGLLGSYAIMTMMYTTFNVVYLGFVVLWLMGPSQLLAFQPPQQYGPRHSHSKESDLTGLLVGPLFQLCCLPRLSGSP